MLVLFFLRRLYLAFITFLVALLCILSFGDILVRLTILPSLESIPKVISLMLPLIAVLAVPLASSLASGFVLGRLYSEDEIIMISFLKRAKRSFVRAVLIFSLTLCIPYSFTVFDWAPTNYFKGKQFIVTLAKEKLSQLEPGIFHNLMSKGVLYFKYKNYELDKQSDAHYKEVLLVYRDPKTAAKYIITAKDGLLQGENLYLYEGTLETKMKDKNYIAGFEKTSINIDQIFNDNINNDIKSRPVKFLTLDQLRGLKNEKHAAMVEYHARIAQVLWQFILPLISLWGIFVWGRVGVNNLMLGIVSASVSFLSSYIVVGVAKALSKSLYSMLLIFYGVPILLFMICIFGRGKRSLI